MSTPLIQPAARQTWAALRMLIVMTVVVGLAYPLAMTGLAQVAFPGRADGSIVEQDGNAVGSSLIGQSFDGESGYFQSRPSAAGDGYDPLASSASNLGPENPDLVPRSRSAGRPPPTWTAPTPTRSRRTPCWPAAPASTRTSARRTPSSRSPGSLASAACPRRPYAQLVDENTAGRMLGFLGEPHVNVLLLNLALDEASGQAD